MSHEITIRANQFAEFASTQAGSWHGLGQVLARGASIDEWATAAGMDWRIQRGTVRYNTARRSPAFNLGVAWAEAGKELHEAPHGFMHGADAVPFAEGWNAARCGETPQRELSDSHVLMRSDTKAPLGIVSDGFKLVQPREILETLAHEARVNGYELETAGTLFGGKRFWALASFEGDVADIVPGDTVRGYTLLVTATDGTLKTTGKKTTVRVVCNNTLSQAMGAKDGTKLAVSHRSVYNKDKMAAALGLIHGDEFATFTDAARRLADKQVGRDRAERLLLSLLAPDVEAKGAAATLPELEKVTESLAFKRIMNLFNGEAKGSAIDGVRGTAWGWLNAVTEYADHHMRATSDDNRRNSAWFGAGDALKNRAADLITA